MNDHLYDLAERVEASGHWRAGKARQFPDDKRNIRSSESLISLAEKLRELPPEDREAAIAYANVMQRIDDLDDLDVAHEIIGVQSQYISRYGFAYPADGNPALFLAGLAEQLAEIVEREESELSEKKRSCASKPRRKLPTKRQRRPHTKQPTKQRKKPLRGPRVRPTRRPTRRSTTRSTRRLIEKRSSKPSKKTA